MVRTTQPSAARRVVKAIRGWGGPARRYRLTGNPNLSGSRIKPQMHRNVYNECALLDRTREWRSPQLACVIN